MPHVFLLRSEEVAAEARHPNHAQITAIKILYTSSLSYVSVPHVCLLRSEEVATETVALSDQGQHQG